MVLKTEELFKALKESPFIGTMKEKDIRVTGLDIFNPSY
jgi:hypothetical protein